MDDIVMLSSERKWSTAGVSVVREIGSANSSPVVTLPTLSQPLAPSWQSLLLL